MRHELRFFIHQQLVDHHVLDLFLPRQRGAGTSRRPYNTPARPYVSLALSCCRLELLFELRERVADQRGDGVDLLRIYDERWCHHEPLSKQAIRGAP